MPSRKKGRAILRINGAEGVRSASSPDEFLHANTLHLSTGQTTLDCLHSGYYDSAHGWVILNAHRHVIVNAFTRLRICTLQGEMDFKFKGEVENIPEGYLPWFEVKERRSADATVIFGHWSALGLKVEPNIIALDTGCLWGGPMTASVWKTGACSRRAATSRWPNTGDCVAA